MMESFRQAQIGYEKTPENWTRRRLRFDAGFNPKKSTVNLKPEDEVSFIPMEAVGEMGGLELNEKRRLEDVYDGYTYLANGDLCIAKITPCFENGKGALAVGLLNGVGFGTTELHVLRPANTIDARFLFYVSMSEDFRKIGASEMLGAGGQKRVPEDFIKDWRPPLPELETQQRIARFLDDRTARIDALIEKKRALLKRLTEKRQALITRAVTKGLNPDVTFSDSGIEWLGKVPEHWEIKRFRFEARLLSGSTPTTTNPDYWDGDIPWISPKDVKTEELTTAQDKVTEFAVTDYGLRVHEQDNAVIVIRGMILARRVPVAVARGRYTVNQDMKVIQSKGDLGPEFFQMYLYAIESFLFTLVAEAGHGTKALRTDVLLDVPVLVPPKHEQRTIIQSLRDNKANIDQAIARIESSIDTLTEYRSALITAAVTGQIPDLR
ncbi:MAG: restriction endonuclease subunit S [Gammaproteobacteria bacterium]